MKVEMRRLADIVPYAANAKKHDARQVANVAESIRQYGFVQPVVVDTGGVIVIGHCRVLAAQKLGMDEVPCVCVSDLTPEQVNALRIVDNKSNESPWDLGLLADELPALDLSGFDFEWISPEVPEPLHGTAEACAAALEDNPLAEDDPEYQAFLEKFAPKKTTDDCYTPQNVYEVAKTWAVEKYGLSGLQVLWPFYPGGDYKAVTYDSDSVVIDNPPFSIISEICEWYTQNGVRFFLFAPALTLFSIGRGLLNYVACGAGIAFENGANVGISFVTNMGSCAVESAPDLLERLDAANGENLRAARKELPKYSYPAQVLTSAMVRYFAAHGVDFRVPHGHLAFTRALDSQREVGKDVFGSGFLISEKAAAEKAAAEKWLLSERELAIVASLGRDGGVIAMATAKKTPETPRYLTGGTKLRFDELAPKCVAMGTLSHLDVDVLAKYVLAEDEYLAVTQKLRRALNAGDADSAGKWLSLQGSLARQCLTLGAELGLTPAARRSRGLIVP